MKNDVADVKIPGRKLARDLMQLIGYTESDLLFHYYAPGLSGPSFNRADFCIIIHDSIWKR